MPLFEYQCQNCTAISEFLVGMTQEKQAIVCPHCGGKKLSRLISPSNIARTSLGEVPRPELPCAGGSCDAGSCPGGMCPMQ